MLGKLKFFLFFLLIQIIGAQVYSQIIEMDATELILTQIAELLSTSEFDKAIALFDEIPAPDRDNAQLLLLKASVMSSAGKNNEARVVTETVLAKEPENTGALFVLAAIESASGRQRQQQTALEKIIAIEPENAEALIALGNLSLQARAVRPAASYFHRVLTSDGQNAEALIGLSRAFRMNREWDQAEILLNSVVELHPEMVEAWNERARFYWGRENLKGALQDLDEAKKLSPNDYWIAIDRGTLLLEMNRKEDALLEFNWAISINPNEYRAYAYTSGLKDDLGDHEGAENDYTILAGLKPDYYFAFEGLGLHKMRKGNWAEARDAFAQAYRYAPDEHLYALLSAINWMRAEELSSPRAYLAQVLNKARRNTLEWYMIRLFHDLTARNYLGENDMASRLDRETDITLKARMLFYMALYYDVRGNTALANKYFLLVNELDRKAIPEWRLNDWILTDRNLKD